VKVVGMSMVIRCKNVSAPYAFPSLIFVLVLVLDFEGQCSCASPRESMLFFFQFVVVISPIWPSHGSCSSEHVLVTKL